MSTFVRALFVREVKGDLPGHEFHGNQYTSGGGEGSFRGESRRNQYARSVAIHMEKDDYKRSVELLRLNDTEAEKFLQASYEKIGKFIGAPKRTVEEFRAQLRERVAAGPVREWRINQLIPGIISGSSQ